MEHEVKHMDIKLFLKERDEALQSLDREQILAYCKKYGAPYPSNERAFWGGVYKTVYNLPSSTLALKEKACKWLTENGMGPEIKL